MSGHLYAPLGTASGSASRGSSGIGSSQIDLLSGDDEERNKQQPPRTARLDHEPMSFKRRQKQSMLPDTARRLLSSLGVAPHSTSLGPNRATVQDSNFHQPVQDSDFHQPVRDSDFHLESVSGGGGGGTVGHNSKPPTPSFVDWYAEGPGRRVGYEDLTAIDWIFEYTKERQRQRLLVAGAGGVLGRVRRLLDAGQIWVVLVLTGLAAGVLAAAIAVATDWLGDLKAGYCASSGPDGGAAFYLNHGFCCLGYSEGAQCEGWKSWAAALGIKASSRLGRWLVEYVFFVVFSLACAVSSALLVREYAVYAKHSGIPEIKTMLGGFVIHRFLGVWTLVTKSLGLCLAVGSGMWLGKEGPLVHVACCCANLFMKLFPNINNNEARKREVLSAAAASGISVAFGSPIGGVLFSLETLSYYFPDKTMWQSFVCAMTAAFVLQACDPFRSGKLVLYQVKYTTSWHAFELVPFALLGILGGLYGGLFIKANMAVARWKKNNSSWLPGPVVQVAAVALLTALVNYPNFYMRAQSSELVSNLFSECSQLLDDQLGLCQTGAATAGTIVLLLLAAVLGFFLAALTFGLQLPAGIILPSMAIGALCGRAVGILMEIWQQHSGGGALFFQACEPDIPCVTPGTYAIVGAAAALAGVTRVTVSIVVIVFELTGALTYVLPIMVAVMLSKWVGDAFAPYGIYDAWIRFNEYPFLDNSEAALHALPDVPAAQAMTRLEDLVVLTATGHTLASLRRVLRDHAYRGFPVVSDPHHDAVLLGYVSRPELAYALQMASQPPRALPPEAEAFFAHQPLADPRSTLDLRPWMDQTPLTLPARASLHLAVSYFQQLGLRYLLLTDRGVLQGLLTKKDVWYILDGADEPRRGGGRTVDTDNGVGMQEGETEDEAEDEGRREGGAEDEGRRAGGML